MPLRGSKHPKSKKPKTCGCQTLIRLLSTRSPFIHTLTRCPVVAQPFHSTIWCNLISSPYLATFHHRPTFPSMASSSLSPATPSQLCSPLTGSARRSRVAGARNMIGGQGKGMMGRRMSISCQATSIPVDRVPDMGKRQLMNLLLLGALSLPTAGMLVPYAAFFAPPGSGGSSSGTVARDALGNEVVAEKWLTTHKAGDRILAQGLKGDPTYLVVENDGTLATYGINAVCTHLGCVVPWNAAENKFICPCHGSQYNNQGKVVRGPAPLSLALAHCDVDDGKVVFVPWVEEDFRTGLSPWWA